MDVSQEATLPENRSKRPWIITMAHKPMYCSNDDSDDCTKANSIVRYLYFFISCPLFVLGMRVRGENPVTQSAWRITKGRLFEI